MQEQKIKNAKTKDYEMWMIILIIAVVLALVIWMLVNPNALMTIADAGNIFAKNFTWLFLIIPLAMIAVALAIAFSPIGKIRMGGPNATPKYSFYSYWIMLWCAGFGSATVVLSFLDWVDIVQNPPFGLEPLSTGAFRISNALSMFEWGFTTCSLNLFLAIPFCYCFYVRKQNAARLGDVFVTMSKRHTSDWFVKLLNVIFIFVVLGGMACTLGYGVPKVTAVVCELTGATNTNVINIVVIVLMAAIFTGSASLGIAKGVQNLSRINMWIIYIFLGAALLIGPTVYVLDNIVNSLGLMVDNFFTMAANTDPFYNSDYAQNNTLFCYCYSWAYVAMMAGFMITISYGRTFREMILSCMVCIPVGVWVMFGINGSIGMYNQLNGKADYISIYNESGSTAAAIEVVQDMGLGSVLGLVAFGLMMIIFVATAMDGTSIVLAQSTMKKVAVGKEPSFSMKFIWCILLAVIPLVMDMLGAELWIFESMANITGWPVMVIGVFLWIFLWRWFKEDKGIEYGHGSKMDLDSELGKQAAAETAERERLQAEEEAAEKAAKVAAKK